MDTFDKYPSLKELLVAAFAGDREAIDELLRRYNHVVCRCTRYHLRRQGCYALDDHGPDIDNSAWFAIIRHSDQLEDEAKFEGWVNKIISRLVSDHVSGPKGCISRQNRTVQLDPTQDASIEDATSIIEASIWVNEMVEHAKAISPMFGEIVRLYHVLGYTMEEVAEELGYSLAKVSSHYYRHLRHLQDLIKGKAADDSGGGGKGVDDGDDGDGPLGADDTADGGGPPGGEEVDDDDRHVH